MARAKFRYVGDHAQDLPGGRVIAPGEFVHLSEEDQKDPFIMDLMANDRIIGTGKVSEEAVESAEAKAERQAKKAGGE